MIEQLWYTWSTSGFGMTSAGYRVRAASPDFMDTNGSVNMQGERFLTLMKHLNYNLPHDTSDPYAVNLQQTPRSLAFVQAGQKHILVNKVYTGLDGIGRPGAYFSHLLTNLPSVSSLSPDEQLPFSAREAIELWESRFWKESEIDSDPKQLGLPQVAPEELVRGSLSEHTVVSATELRSCLSYVIEAFLTLPKHKRLYVAGPSKTVATLIWGLTHALPRTLDIMRDLTFSTYERDIEERKSSLYGQQATEKTSPIIVGTCWLSPSGQDLPAIYYQEQNPHGLAINCYRSDQRTPLASNPLISKFADFAVQCFVSQNANKLMALLNEAEKHNITEVSDFLDFYTSCQENLSKKDIIRILTKLCIKMQTLLENVLKSLNEVKIPPENEFWQWKSIQSEADMLQRPNVRNSIMRLLTNEQSWWQQEGQDIIQKLCRLADYSDSNLPIRRTRFIEAFRSSALRSKGFGEEIKKKVGLSANSSVENDPSTVATTFADEATSAIQKAQKELTDALVSLVTDFADQVVQAICANDAPLTTLWYTILTNSISNSIKVNIWTHIINKLSKIQYTSVYQQWWNGYGKTSIQKMSNLPDAQRSRELDQDCDSFIAKAAQELLEAIKNNQTDVLRFWQDVLYTTAPSAHQRNSDVWLSLLVGLCQAMHIPAYRQWWEAQGRAAARSLRSLADKSPQSKIAHKLSDCAYNTSVNVLTLIDESVSKIPDDNYIKLLIEILDIVTPAGSTNVWLGLVTDLCKIVDAPAYRRWWQLQGKRVISSLRQIADKSPQSEIAHELSDCAQHAINELYIRLVNNASEIHQVDNIQLLLELIDMMLPTGNTALWPNLLQKLSTTIHPQAFSWELRALLLQTWGKIPILEGDNILHNWLTVSWQELDKFLSLKLPASWQKVGIKGFIVASDYSQVDVMSIVKEHQRLFEDVLEHLMKTPAHQQHAVRFFALLAQHSYHNFPLLDKMLAACYYHEDMVEGLLAPLQLGSRDVVNLLENHCQVLLSEHKLTPTLVKFIRYYLDNFDPDFLDASPTQKLLLRLLRGRETGLPPDLYKFVEDWYRIAEFMQDPDVGRNRLRDLSHGTRTMTQLTSDARKKLVAKLVPRLVDSISTEMDLVRVIDNLGKVLVGQGQGGIDSDLLLLEQMTKIAGEKYGQERSLVRIAPYIKVVLNESCFLPLAKKENFVDRCFTSLLKQVNTKPCDTFSPKLMLWTNNIIDEWQAYLSRSSSAAIIEAINRFRRALDDKEMFTIVNAYNPSLESHLTSQEFELQKLARKFVTAYQNGDDASLVDAYRAITGSPYHQMLGCTQTQTDRLNQAKSRMSATAQPSIPGVVSRKYSQTPSLPSVPQPVSGNSEPIAKVKGQIITLEWFEWACQLKGPYTEYRMSALQQQIQQHEQFGPADKKSKKADLNLIKGYFSELNNISGNSDRLREATLEDLVNDVLIREKIDKWTGQNQGNNEHWFNKQDALLQILNQLESRYRYPSQDASTTPKILEILRIFCRYEWYADYLYKNQKVLLKEWLKEQRCLEETQIHIDYGLARVKAPSRPSGLIGKILHRPK